MPLKHVDFLDNFSIRQNQVIFLVYGKNRKKIGSVSRQNKNNIIWFLGSVVFKKNNILHSKHRRKNRYL